MADRDFDEIRDKLYNLDEPVDTDIWQDIQSSMRRRRLRRAFYYTMSTAAAVAVVFMLLVNPHRRIKEVELLAAAAVAAYEMALPQSAIMESPKVQNTQVASPVTIFEPTVSEDISDTQESVHTTPDNIPTIGETKSVKQQTKSASKAEIATVTQSEETTENSVAEQVPAYSVKEERNSQYLGGNNDVIDLDLWNYSEEIQAKKKYTLAFNGGIMPGSSASVSGPTIMATSAFSGSNQQSYIVEQVSDTKYSLPLNLGVQFQFPVGDNLALGIGLNYTMLKSKFDCLVNKIRYNGKQTLHYIGLPVNVYGIIANKNNFTFYINGGAMIEKGLKAKYEFNSYLDSHSHSMDIDGVQFSFNAGMGVEYKLANHVGLYFEPNIVYFINPDIQYCIRTDQPLQIKGELGCRFHF